MAENTLGEFSDGEDDLYSRLTKTYGNGATVRMTI